MGKDLSISVLMDFYSDLLTEKQKDTLDLYYNSDYSLAEIAEHLDISRQGVRDFIKRGEKQLVDFENSLKMVERFKVINKRISQFEELLSKMDEKNSDVIRKDIQEILDSIKSSL